VFPLPLTSMVPDAPATSPIWTSSEELTKPLSLMASLETVPEEFPTTMSSSTPLVAIVEKRRGVVPKPETSAVPLPLALPRMTSSAEETRPPPVTLSVPVPAEAEAEATMISPEPVVMRSASLSVTLIVPVLPEALPMVTLPALTNPVVMVAMAESPLTSPARKLPLAVCGEVRERVTVPRLKVWAVESGTTLL